MLFLDRSRDGRGAIGDLGDGFGNEANGIDGLAGFVLDREDLLVDFLGRLGGLVGKVLTSLATTAKPLPASPARAASMVALSARRLVWDAISLIRLTT